MDKKARVGDGELRRSLLTELRALLAGGRAHAPLAKAVAGMPPALRGEVPAGLPYSAWQLVEHMRLAQRDILDFCQNGDGSYQPRAWPAAYWPDTPQPPNATAWDESVEALRVDGERLQALLDAADEAALVRPFPWGQGQTLLHEALLIADHTAYHTGELVVLRRLLGVWA